MQLDLSLTMDSGQTPTFTWKKQGENHYVSLDGKHYLKQLSGLEYSEGFDVAAFFKLKDDLKKIHSKIIEDDDILSQAINQFNGLRLTKSNEWETLCCFLISQNNNIKRIQGIVSKLYSDSSFLTPEQLLRTNLTPLKLGYREKYLVETARLIVENGFNLEKIKRKNAEDAREQLCELPGVGRKVADCVLLYGFGRNDVFPADVWVNKAMLEWYGVPEKQVQEFASEKWGKHAGYAQQLLFCKARKEL
ncbi:DNA-3-methyladenine glycosylase 2 family protein [Candidatus Micrarchaeota archaeon]|nr:DNA-3-methyladenine glycosylase 2 family protein [Candidatus Micrarchaeota archaeon]